MNSSLTLVLGLIAAIIAILDVYATVRIWRDDLLERSQQIAQTVFVWILPFIGALVALWSLREEKVEERPYESPGGDSGRFL